MTKNGLLLINLSVFLPRHHSRDKNGIRIRHAHLGGRLSPQKCLHWSCFSNCIDLTSNFFFYCYDELPHCCFMASEIILIFGYIIDIIIRLNRYVSIFEYMGVVGNRLTHFMTLHLEPLLLNVLEITPVLNHFSVH